MKSRPILFTGEMVRAILSGAKTQTRRVVKGLDIRGPDKNPSPLFDVYKGSQWVGAFDAETGRGSLDCPYGEPGDRLWVRETWALMGPDHSVYTGPMSGLDESESLRCYPIYRESPGFVADRKWRPSIFMPKRFCRITLEVTGVRVERVQDIADLGLVAEGIPRGSSGVDRSGLTRSSEMGEAFQDLWDSINAKRGYGWDTNPWVWAVSFKRLD